MSDLNFEHLSPLFSPKNKRKLIKLLSVIGDSGQYLRETRQKGVSNKIETRFDSHTKQVITKFTSNQ
jgi:hypothetical protein